MNIDHHFRRSFRITSFVAVAGATLALTPHVAEANSAGTWSLLQPLNPAQRSCTFPNADGTVNNCGAPVSFEFPLMGANAGVITAKVSGYSGNAATPLRCNIGSSTGGGYASYGPTTYWPQGYSTQPVNGTVLSGGDAYLGCTLQQSDSLDVVFW